MILPRPHKLNRTGLNQFLDPNSPSQVSGAKIFKLKVTTAKSKIKSRSHHDVAHLHPLTNGPTKYQLPTPYSFWDTAQTNFYLPPAQTPIRTPWVKTIPRGLLGKKQYWSCWALVEVCTI